MSYVPIRIQAPTAPGSGETVTLFDSAAQFNGVGLAMMCIRRVLISFPGLDEDSAADGLKGYVSPDKGVSWYPTKFATLEQLAADPTAGLPDTVTADDGTDHWEGDFDVAPFADVKFTYTATASAPSVWSPVIKLETDRHGAV